MRARDAGERVSPIGYLDDNPDSHGQTLLGLPVLGSLADFAHIAHDALIIAIGDNRTRQSLFDQLQQQGECYVTVRHPTAVIAPDGSIGLGTIICGGTLTTLDLIHSEDQGNVPRVWPQRWTMCCKIMER